MHKAGRAPHCAPAVTADFLTVIRQHRQGVHVAFNRFCRAKNFTTDRMTENVRMQSLSEIRSFRQFENPVVIHNAGTDVTPAQWNDPNPPAAAEQMIRSPFTASATTIGVVREAFSPVVAIPLFNVAEACPDRIDGVFGVRTKMSQFPGEHRRAPCRIDDPTAGGGAFASIQKRPNPLAVPVVQFAACYLGGTPEFAAGLHREVEQV